MRNRGFFPQLVTLAMVVSAFCFGASRAEAAFATSFGTTNGASLTNLTVGQTFTLTFNFTGQDAANFMISYAETYNFGSGFFAVNSITQGPADAGSTFASSSNASSFTISSSGAAQSPIFQNGVEASINLTALRAGSGSFIPANGSSAQYSNSGSPYTSAVFTINPAAVPEPSSLALCGIASLVGLGYARSRGKRVA